MKLITLTAAFFVAFAGTSYAVDGVIEINQARALAGGVTPGDTPGFPVTISQPGSYRLSGSLTPAGLTGIIVTADDVTIDLNGFAIVGPEFGITGRGNLVVANGSILSVVQDGIVLGSGRVERVRVQGGPGGASHGIAGLIEFGGVSPGVLISDCMVSGTHLGISVSVGVVTGNVVVGTQKGIAISSGLVTGNHISEYTVVGIDATEAGYAGNVISRPPAGGNAVIGNGIQLGPNLCGAALCP